MVIGVKYVAWLYVWLIELYEICMLLYLFYLWLTHFFLVDTCSCCFFHACLVLVHVLKEIGMVTLGCTFLVVFIFLYWYHLDVSCWCYWILNYFIFLMFRHGCFYVTLVIIKHFNKVFHCILTLNDVIKLKR